MLLTFSVVSEQMPAIKIRAEYKNTPLLKTKLFYLWRPYLKDPFDDHVLEVTIQSNASTIVTYNKKNFKETENLGLKILTPKEFLETSQEV